MTIAIKCVHNLPPHLSHVATLPNITQKPKRDIDDIKQRLIDTLYCIAKRIIDEATGRRQICMYQL